MNTTETSSGAYILLYFIPRLLITQKVTIYDIFMCIAYLGLHNLHARVALRNVKCHPKFNFVEGVLSQGFYRTLVQAYSGEEKCSDTERPLESRKHYVASVCGVQASSHRLAYVPRSTITDDWQYVS